MKKQPPVSDTEGSLVLGFRSNRTCLIVNDPDEKTVSILARIFETPFSLEPVLGGEKKEERPAFGRPLGFT